MLPETDRPGFCQLQGAVNRGGGLATYRKQAQRVLNVDVVEASTQQANNDCHAARLCILWWSRGSASFLLAAATHSRQGSMECLGVAGSAERVAARRGGPLQVAELFLEQLQGGQQRVLLSFQPVQLCTLFLDLSPLTRTIVL